MNKYLVLLVVLCHLKGVSQEVKEVNAIEDDIQVVTFNNEYQGTKTTAYIKKRSFEDGLESKYSGSDFTYTEEKEPPVDTKKKEENPAANSAFFTGFINFMTLIFPYLFGLLVVFIIVKTLIGSDIKFWKFSKTTKFKAAPLLFDEEVESISATDFDSLLKRALASGDYRLATRYHYLSALKILADKELIKYHKEKTNAAYLLELKNKELRARFSYLSYIYNYVWYGEFSINAQMFKKIDTKYKSFLSSIH